MTQFRTDKSEFLNHNRSIYEVVMVADQYGNMSSSGNPNGMAVDAFGRARISTPLTLFDSSHRYNDNGLWSYSNTAGTTVAFNANAGLIEMTLPTTSGAEIIRETTKVFSYQPGKSLQTLNTFCFNPAKANLRQRVGYFGADNGIFLELDGSTLYFVERSKVTGSVTETKVAQQDWNIDTLLGSELSSPSHMTLDITKAQILFSDIEWLGIGTVRVGFVIDGRFIHCHSFHHANFIDSTYITTASLPLRYEIKNNGGATSSSSTMKQVCSSVISEGGYDLYGAQRAIVTPINLPIDLGTSGTIAPVISIRLKTSPNRLDAIVILTAISIMGVTNNCNYNWQVVSSGTTSGGTWTSLADDSSVEYNITGSSFTGGRILASGFLSGSAQGTQSVDILKESLFKFQLERNSLTSTPFELTLVASASLSGGDILAAMDFEEISR